MNDERELCAMKGKSKFDLNESANLLDFGLAKKFLDSHNIRIRIRTPSHPYCSCCVLFSSCI